MTGADPLTIGTESFSVEVRPDRGLDLGQLTFGGHRLEWTSPLGDADVFPGGLLTTCGLHNVGPAGEGHELHGAFTRTPARGVRLAESPEGHGEATVVTASIVDGDLRCERRITIRPAAGSITVEDVVSNPTAAPVQAPLLYHVNWGGAFLDDSLVIEIPAIESLPRDADSGVMAGDWRRPATVGAEHEVVLEHLAGPGLTRSEVALTNRPLGVRAVMTWRGLDRLHQWIDLSPTRGVAAIEPANCSVNGRAADRRVRRAPFIAPHANRSTALTITLEEP